MVQLRLVWLLVGLAGLAAVAALAGGLSFYGQPDPHTASREAILRWLATSDLRDEPLATQDALVDRLADELRRDANFSAAGEPNQSQRETLASNVELLKARWFVTRVNRYDQLAALDRNAYLDDQIATLLAWAKIDAALEEGKSAASNAGAASAFVDIERWIENERDAVQQARMNLAVHDGIVRWLATHDLSEQPPAVRRNLALVIAAGLNAGIDVASVTSRQSTAEQKLLRENGRLLMEAWLLAQAKLYAALPADERSPFIDAWIGDVSRWRVLELLNEGQSLNVSQPALGMAELRKWIDTWIARAEPEQQAQLRALSSDVQSRLLQRIFQSLRGG